MRLGQKLPALMLVAGLLLSVTAKTETCGDEVAARLSRAEEQIMKTDNREEALRLIDMYESVLEIDPENYEALWSLARYNILVGVAYTEEKKEKRKYYTRAAEYSERAMLTNPEVRARVENGEKIWNASDALTEKEMAGLYYWYNAHGMISKECQSRLQQVLYSYRLPRFRKVMTRMLEIDPEWAGGHPYFAWAAFYAAVPKIMGQDLDKAEEFFEKAEQAGPNWIYIRWSKALLLHTQRNDREAFVRDLEWVLAQDPKEADSPYPMNVYFQREARYMLDHVDEYFEE